MHPDDPTEAALCSIREDLQGLRGDLRGLQAELELTNVRLDRLERRHTDTEVRLASEIAGVLSAVHQLREGLHRDLSVQERIEDHERRIATLEGRVG